MKLLLVLFLFLASSQLEAQDNYQNIKKLVDNNIQAYSKNGKANDNLNKIIINFNQSKKNNIKDLKKGQIGICMVLSVDNPELVFSPAKYTFEDEKVNISAIRSKSSGELTDDMKDFVQKYLTQFEKLGTNKLFRNLVLKEIPTEGILAENKTEFIVNEPNTLSFIRGNEDWMFIVSIDNEYKRLENPRIIIYAFRMSFSGKDIFDSNNSLEDIEIRRKNEQARLDEDRANYPLYHDFRIDDLRVGLKQLLEYEPYKSNQELLDHANKINEKLDRFTIRNYIKELKYFANLKINKDFLKEHFDNPLGNFEVDNIMHISAHALGDIYLSQQNYQLAKDFYINAVFANPLVARSGTIYSKDVDRIIYDLSKNAYKSNKKDESYAFLIALMFAGNINTAKDIDVYFKEYSEDKKKFKIDLDKSLKTLKKSENYVYTFTFRKNEVFFIPMLQATVKSFEEVFKNNEFYKSLE